MSEDKRRYLPRSSRKDAPIKAEGGGSMAKDGYVVRHREPYERKNDGKVWSRNRDISPGLRDENEVSSDSYLMD